MEPTTSTTTARDELAQLVMMIAVHPDLLDYRHGDYSSGAVCLGDARRIADKALAAGYRKPRVLGYVPVNREGAIRSRPFHSREEVQTLVDAWNRADGTINYSVAEIVEPVQ